MSGGSTLTPDFRAWLQASVAEPRVREAAVCLPGRVVWGATHFRDAHEVSASTSIWRSMDDFFAVMRLHSVRVSRMAWIMDSAMLVLFEVRGVATGGLLCDPAIDPGMLEELLREFEFAVGTMPTAGKSKPGQHRGVA
jgi:hypothetical protein